MNYDVCVIGGGTAGCFAAISAAQKGLKVLIVEKYGCLGGTSVNSLVTPSMPTYVKKSELYYQFETILMQYEGELYSPKYQELRDQATIDRPNESTQVMYFSPISMQYTLEEMCETYKVQILYDTVFVTSNVEDGKIASVTCQTISGPIEIIAENFVDSSGDGLLSELSGIKMMCGNEETSDNQYTSLRFEIAGIDNTKFLQYLNEELRQKDCVSNYPHYTFAVTHQGRNQELEFIMKKALADQVITEQEYVWLQGFSMPSKPGVYSFNCPRIPNKTNISDPFIRSSNYIKGRKMILKYAQMMKIYLPGFENSYLTTVAPMLGVRESKRITGKYIISKDDYLLRKKFDDGIAASDWWIDIHKKDHKQEEEFLFNYGEFFEIPYRALVTNEISNLIVCGRCISSDFSAQASVRIQPQCRMMGEAAGLALVYAKQNKVELNQIDGKVLKEEMEWMQ